jgi:peptidoglycan/LPS O-acetylase OafA/YrhL
VKSTPAVTPSEVSSPSVAFRTDVEGLRALAVLPILIFHLNPDWMPGGFEGVDMFFVISGFLISSQILKRSPKQFGFVAFYVRRIRRLFPALIITVVASVIVGWRVLTPEDYSALARSALASMTGVANLYFFWTVDYFNASALLHPLLHIWSLGVEEQFYLVWPAFLIASRCCRPRVLRVAVVAALVASLGASVFYAARAPYLAFYMMPLRIFEFSIGTAILLFDDQLRRLPKGLCGFLGAAMLAASLWLLDGHTPWPGLHALAPCLGTALLMIAGRQGGWHALLSMMPLRLIGRISYSIYLVHWPLIVFYRYWLVVAPTSRQLLMLFAASIALGAILYLSVERVFRVSAMPSVRETPAWGRFFQSLLMTFEAALARWRDRLFRVFLIVPLMAACFCAVVIARHGFPDRMKTHRVRQKEGELSFGGDLCDSSRARCGFGDSASSQVVYLVGDSYALNLVYGLDRLFKRRKIRGIALYDHGCLFLKGTKRFISGAPDKVCQKNIASAFDQLARDRHPVMFAGAYANYVRNIGDANANSPFGGVGKDYFEWMGERFQSSLRFIGANNRVTMVMASSYSTGINTAKCAAIHGADAYRCRPATLAQARKKTKAADAMIEGLRQYFPKLVILDSKTAFCDNEHCIVRGNGAPYFRDTAHLTTDGSAFLIDRLEPQLLLALDPKR